jgi:cell division protein FtsW
MNADRGLFLTLIAVLVGFGTLMVYSASITSWPSDFEQVYLSRHLVFLLLGIGMAAASAHVPAEQWRRFAPVLFVVTVGLLVLVLMPGFGVKINGARRWLRFAGFSLQPSELAKLALPLLLARMMTHAPNRSPLTPVLSPATASTRFRSHKAGERGTSVGRRLLLLVPAAVVVPLVVKEPDLGTAVFLLAGCAIALFAGGWPLRYFVVLGTIAIPAGVALMSLKPYQMERITGFLSAWDDFEQAPYQLKQSILTLASGGLDGVGIGKGRQKLSFLPEANTDFVFAVVGEELGLIGTVAIIALWIALYVVGLRMLRRLPPRSFESIAGFTLLTQLVLQAALNVAVVTALVPPKGISHPFLSSGGSNLVMSLITIGVLVSLSKGSDTEATGAPV